MTFLVRANISRPCRDIQALPPTWHYLYKLQYGLTLTQVKTKTELVIHNVGITRSADSLAKPLHEVKNSVSASETPREVTNMS